MDKLNIYQRLHLIQAQTGKIARTELNKFQNYKYFTEQQALNILKPLLAEQKLTLTFSDGDSHFACEKQEKDWAIQYRKQAILTNSDNPEEQLTFNFWACGQNQDIAKAKGCAETYAIKYFLTKFFLIPTTDELDPDVTKDHEQTNLINQEETINTRKEHWDNLFLFVDFSRMGEPYLNMWSKEYKLLPLPKPYQDIKQKFANYCQNLNQQVENLINSYAPYFQANIYPLLNKPEGDKTLLFRSKRLLNNKIIGESSSLFLDLVTWEVEYRQVEAFKELLRQLNSNPMFLTDREDEAFANDLEKMEEGRINYLLSQRFYLKWNNLIAKSGIQKEEWQEIGDYLKEWQKGKGAESEWREGLKRMEETRDRAFELGSESISDGLPFLQLGKIKQDNDQGLVMVCQNKKAFNLHSPYLRIVNFHQKVYRVYIVSGFEMVDPRRLYMSIYLKEDWVWKDYPWIISSLGSLNSGNHPIYQKRNLPD